MKLEAPVSIKFLADFLGCTFLGNENHLVTGLNEIHRVEKGDLVFVDHPKYYAKALKSNATTILIDKEVSYPAGKALLISAAPFDDFNRLIKKYAKNGLLANSIGDTANVHSTASIAPNVVLGNNVSIGAHVVINPGVVIHDNVIIEENVIIGANTVIGSNAFYYKKNSTGYDPLITCGAVHIHKNVEIGALCTVDAGVTATTIIGEGTKIDNQVQIGHDTIIGKHCLLAANVGLAGCVELKDNVTFWGQVGCASDVVIGENVVVLAQSGISKDLPANKTYFGSPCKETRYAYRELAALRKLPEILENL